MANLTDDVKRFIVQALACYDTPTQVAEAVSQEFNIKIDRSQAALYDPTAVRGKNLSKKWRDLFDATRKQFLDEAGSIPIANQSFRLRSLNQLHQKAVSKGNAVLASQLLEQAAKEIGGAFTNRTKVDGTLGIKATPELRMVLNGAVSPSAAD